MERGEKHSNIVSSLSSWLLFVQDSGMLPPERLFAVFGDMGEVGAKTRLLLLGSLHVPRLLLGESISM